MPAAVTNRGLASSCPGWTGAPPDDTLLDSGRTRGVRRILRAPRALIFGFFGAVTRRPEVAADLTAETFAAALDGVDGFDPERGNARMWLFGIARNLLAQSARRGRVESAARRRIGLDAAGAARESHRADRAAGRGRGRRDRRGVAGELPAEQAEALRARVLDEREYADIASDLRCSEAVVRQRVSRGLGRLRRRMSEGAG